MFVFFKIIFTLIIGTIYEEIVHFISLLFTRNNLEYVDYLEDLEILINKIGNIFGKYELNINDDKSNIMVFKTANV